MDRPVKMPSMPALPANLDPALRDWCQSVEMILQIQLGLVAKNTNSRFVTIHDLVATGIVPDGVLE